MKKRALFLLYCAFATGASAANAWTLGGDASGTTSQLSAEDEKNLEDSIALVQAIEDSERRIDGSTASGRAHIAELEKMKRVQIAYQKALRERPAANEELESKLQKLADAASQIDLDDFARKSVTNADLMRFEASKGPSFSSSAQFQKYLSIVRRDSASGTASRIVGNPAVAEAVDRHRAAILAVRDLMASEGIRIAAGKYLVGEGMALNQLHE